MKTARNMFCDARGFIGLSVMSLCLLTGFWATEAMATAQSRRVVTDSFSGYAIYGYDPVAYFTDHAAKRGKREYEFVWNGVSWLFETRANLEVFKADPDVYAPAYGGHGALAMARGYAAGCNPTVWALYGDRLFLFYTHTSRAAWAEAVEAHIRKSDEVWTVLEGTLSRQTSCSAARLACGPAIFPVELLGCGKSGLGRGPA